MPPPKGAKRENEATHQMPKRRGSESKTITAHLNEDALLELLDRLPLKELLDFEATSKYFAALVKRVFTSKRKLIINVGLCLTLRCERSVFVRGVRKSLLRCPELRTFRFVHEAACKSDHYFSILDEFMYDDMFAKAFAHKCPHVRDFNIYHHFPATIAKYVTYFESGCQITSLTLDSDKRCEKVWQLCLHAQELHVKLAAREEAVHDFNWLWEDTRLGKLKKLKISNLLWTSQLVTVIRSLLPALKGSLVAKIVLRDISSLSLENGICENLRQVLCLVPQKNLQLCVTARPGISEIFSILSPYVSQKCEYRLFRQFGVTNSKNRIRHLCKMQLAKHLI